MTDGSDAFTWTTHTHTYDDDDDANSAPAAATTTWLRGVVVNALVAINEVALQWARLVLGWVTVCGQVNHLGT